jgi:phosphocarrier protein
MSTGEQTALSASAIVGSSIGLHARPAAIVAKAVGALGATVSIAKGEKGPVSAASPLMIITLGARCGDEVVVTADGPGAARALEEITALIASDLDAEEEGDGH